jgi:GTP-binding protein
MQLQEWLVFNQKPRLVIATKSDKLSKNELRKNLQVITETMPLSKVIAYSAPKGIGREEIWREIEQKL